MTRGTRKLHTWVGLIAGAPFLIMIISALLVIHGNRLGLDRAMISVAWLPSYDTRGARPHVVTVLYTAEGQYIGTDVGLYFRTHRSQPVSEVMDQEIRALLSSGGRIFAVTSTGFWVKGGSGWSQLLKGDITSATVSEQRIAAMTRRRGLLVSGDGGSTWTPAGVGQLPAIQQHAAVIPLKKLVSDVHTGNALFGSRQRWIWTDIVAVSFAVMVLSGLWGWYRTRRSRARAKNFAAAKQRVA